MAGWSDWASSLRGILGLPDPQQSQGLLSDPYINTGAKTATVMGLLADRAAPKLAGIPGSVADAATLPGDTYLGKVDLNTDQGFGRAMNMVGLLATGGMPMAEAGAAGIFGGKLTRDPAGFARMGEGSEMAASGASPESVYKATGTWRGPDKLSRYEIPDADSALSKPALKSINEGRSFEGKLGDFLDHPELYQAYPHLAETPVSFNPSSIHGGAYTPPTGNFTPPNLSIMVGGNDPAKVHSVLLHEVQHAVQAKEGFTPGWSSVGAANLREGLAQQAEQAGMAPEKIKDFLVNFDPYDAYRRAAGEVEARAVQARQNLTPDQARVFNPWLDMTAQAPASKWIVRQPLGLLGQR
jgi:hypothetical protein